MPGAPPPRTTIGNGLDLHDNALNLLRLVFAALVIATHSRPLTGTGAELEPLGVPLGGLAVGGFFAISGYLITGSRLHLPGREFALRRLTRIFPAYWLCSIVTAFGLAAVIGLERGGWSLSAAYRYVLSGLGMVGWSPTVGGVLDGAPVDDSMNASLWTLPVEILCYLGLGLVLTVLWARRRLRVSTTLLFLVASGVAVGSALTADGPAGLPSLAASFMAGSVLFAWRISVPLHGAVALVSVVAYVLCFQHGVTVALAALPGAYTCLWLGAVIPRPLRGIGRRHDISYGLYLYGWPVQQTLVALGLTSLRPGLFALVALIVCTPLAWCSWVLLERPVLTAVKGVRSPTRAGLPATEPPTATGCPAVD